MNSFSCSCGWPVLAPCTSLVEYKSSIVDQFSGMLVGSSAKRYAQPMDVLPLKIVRFAEDGNLETDKQEAQVP